MANNIYVACVGRYANLYHFHADCSCLFLTQTLLLTNSIFENYGFTLFSN